MKKEELFNVIGKVDEQKVATAGMAMSAKKKSRPVWVKWGTMAACFALVVISAITFFPNLGQPGITPPDNPSSTITPPNEQSGIVAENPNDDNPPTSHAIHISMDSILLNELSEVVSAAPRWYDPKLYDNITWDMEAITAYFGKNIVPVYTPNDMKMEVGSKVVSEKSGKIVMDTVWIGYSVDNTDTSSPKIDIAASKLGLLRDCIYLLPENEVKTSDIGGTNVTFGYRSMPYGPYDTETKEPTGYYDMYVVDFTHDEIEYQIVAQRTDIEEVVKIASSIIYGEEVEIDN